MLKNKSSKFICIVIWVVMFALILSSCGVARRPREEPGRQPPDEQVEKPNLPELIRTEGDAEPRLKVFIVDENRIEEMPFEEYVAGVVGGEIKNDWPIESIKAQAIIARTFVLRFIEDKGQSRHNPNAHVSTDIEEAQAWNKEAVNEQILKAVQDTKGQVMVNNGQFANTWFHSNAAGKTATATEGLAFKETNPPYIKVVDSPDDSPDIPADQRDWTVSFPKAKVIEAIGETGGQVQDFANVSIAEKGPSGRAVTLKFDQTEVSAPNLRIALGSTELKSTLLDSVALEGDQVVFRGRGFGHGVGMSQWGAYSFAKNGKSDEEILNHYFRGTSIVTMWN